MRSNTNIPNLLSRHALLMLVTAMLAWAGCDTSEDEGDGPESDAEQLVGTWGATAIKAGPIDVLGLLGLSMTLALEPNGDARIDVIDGDVALDGITGTYVVDEQSKMITLNGNDVEDDLVMKYVLVDVNSLSLEIDGSDLANLGIDLGEFEDLVAGVVIDVDLQRDGV